MSRTSAARPGLHNYLVLKEIACLVKSKFHLTPEGLEKIVKLKEKLNV